MRLEKFFSYLLGLKAPWRVKGVDWSDEADKVDVYLVHENDALFRCPLCGRRDNPSGSGEAKTWRHLDTCGKSTYLHASLPFVLCPEHGRSSVEPPWADGNASMSSALERLCLRLAKEFGGARMAARLTGMNPGEVQKAIAASRQRRQAARPQTEAVPPTADESPDQLEKPRVQQLSLYAQKDMPLINEGVQALKALEPEKAVELFEKHRKLFPRGYDVTSRIALAQSLLDGLRRAPVDQPARLAHMCSFWSTFENRLSTTETGKDPLVEKIKRSFFEKALQEAESSGLNDMLQVAKGVPLGYVYLQAGQIERAVQSLQASILHAPDSAEVYAYLGDAYWLRKDFKTARQCYREACLIDPVTIDWSHLKDGELKDLKQDLQTLYGFDEELAAEWLPSHARISGLFERKVLRLHEGLKEIVDAHLAVQKAVAKKGTPRLQAKLFFSGIVICENEENFKFVKKINLIQVREKMKQANPDLFAEFLETLAAEQGSTQIR